MLFAIVSRILGLLLLTAASLKVYGLGIDPVPGAGVFSAPAVQFLVIAFEFALGVWLVSGWQPSGAWLAVLVTFVVFVGASFYQGWVGQASCGCFGRMTVNPWYAFGIDIAAIAALLFARPDLRPLWEYRARITRTAACVFAGYLLLLGLLAGLAQYRYGSIGAAIASLRHERLSVNPALVDMGVGIPGESREASVELTNRTDGPIRLIGGTADCSCTVIGDLPITIPPGEARSITITMRLPQSTGMFTRKAELTIDDKGFKRVSFRLTGRISKLSETPERAQSK